MIPLFLLFITCVTKSGTLLLLSSKNSSITKQGRNLGYTTDLHLNNNMNSLMPTMTSSLYDGNKPLMTSMVSNTVNSTENIPANTYQTLTSRWIKNKTRSYIGVIPQSTWTVQIEATIQRTMTETWFTSPIIEINDTDSSESTNTYPTVHIKARSTSEIQHSEVITTKKTPIVEKSAQQIINCDLLRNLGFNHPACNPGQWT